MTSPKNKYNTQGGAVFNGNLAATRDINITHITSLQPLARSLHKFLFAAPDLFKRIQRELSDLIVILDTTEQNSAELQSTKPQYDKLQTNLEECRVALLQLHQMKDHFDSVGPTTQATWERMRWNENELAAIRAQIKSHIRALNHLNTAAIISSQANIKRILDGYINEIRTGARDKSVISSDSLNKDERQSWRMLRKELQSVGITPEIFSQHQVMIVSALRSALDDDATQVVSSFTGGERDSESLSSSSSHLNAQLVIIRVALENAEFELLKKNEEAYKVVRKYFSDKELRGWVACKGRNMGQRERDLVKKCVQWAILKDIPFIQRTMMRLLMRVVDE